MGIFDRPKNYRMRDPQTIHDFFWRLDNCIDCFNDIKFELWLPLIDELLKKDKKRFFKELDFIELQIDRIKADPFAFNHRTLGKLATVISDFGKWCFNKQKKIGMKTSVKKYEIVYGEWEIKINGKVRWYLGKPQYYY